MTKIETGNRVFVKRTNSTVVGTFREIVKVCTGNYTARVQPDNGVAFCCNSRNCKVTYCY